MRVAIYSRVSTNRQDIKNQLLELRKYCQRMNYEIFNEYSDIGISGTKFDRPGLQLMLSHAFKREFDILLVWKLDRLGRSMVDLINILDKLRSKNIDFVCLTQNIDTTTPAGKLMFHIIGAVAEFERDLIKERVKAGLIRAREDGIKLGRPPIENDIVERIKKLREKNYSMREISNKLNVSVGKVHGVLKHCSEN